MNIRSTINFALIALFASSSFLTYAEDASVDSNGVSPVISSTSGDANYLNGGIGSEEADAIRLKAASFSLRVTFSQGINGNSIADVYVTISDSKGNSAFQLPDAGPILYVKLPDGHYTLSAQYNGVSQTKKFTINGKKGTNVYLNWKALPADALIDANRIASPP